MENKFNSIVLSTTEPDTGSLWMRQVEDKGQKLGHSLWWFTSEGWKKLFDFDTRYNMSTEYKYSESESPYESKSEYDPESGVVKSNITYYLYDASRDISDSLNIVTEKGLKVHIDSIKEEITSLKNRVSATEVKYNELSGRVDNISNSLNGTLELLQEMNGTLSSIDNRLTALETS